jgi:two-component system, chemotaxis family, protein-glutamate methylesterase/glutaminase
MSAVAKAEPVAVVAVAASAGGVEALKEFAAALPGDFAGAVLIVLHLPPGGPSVLPAILTKAGELPARHPVAGEELRPGVILAAPPDRHMVVSDRAVTVIAGPRENGHRPSADVLLRSVAAHYGERAAGVILSGTMDDGAAGLRALGIAGGLTLVQDPKEAAFPGMPLAAIAAAEPKVVGSVSVIVDHLCQWIARLPDKEINLVSADRLTDQADTTDLTPLTCPECGGSLWRRNKHGAELFRCRVGHTYSADGLLLGKQAALEAGLWAAIVALEERAEVSRRIIRRLRDTGRDSQLARYRQDVAEAEKRAQLLRELMDDLVQEVSTSHDEGVSGGTASQRGA